MDIDDRIKRRQHQADVPRLIQGYESLSPISHIDEPAGRGPVLERLLDHLDPVFGGQLPPNGYVSGPFGAGKSAIVTALFRHLDQLSFETQSIIHTSTRGTPSSAPQFGYVDLRGTTSEFSFYHDVLDSLVEESVPEHGISTEGLHDRLHELLRQSRAGAVIAVDHADEVGTDASDLIERFAGLPNNTSWLAIGRTPPQDSPLTAYTGNTITVEPYRSQTLVDVLMIRASEGLTQQALDHERARQIADWAEGNAHDALAALFIGVERASQADRTRLTESDIDEAIEEIPQPSVSLGSVFALPANKQLVLRELVDLPQEKRASVTATTEAISAKPAIDLSAGTVKRFLYEMAEIGVVERVQAEQSNGKGRPPSRVELRFPPTVFRRLYDLER